MKRTGQFFYLFLTLCIVLDPGPKPIRASDQSEKIDFVMKFIKDQILTEHQDHLNQQLPVARQNS